VEVIRDGAADALRVRDLGLPLVSVRRIGPDH
jgi:hypothetical protein